MNMNDKIKQILQSVCIINESQELQVRSIISEFITSNIKGKYEDVNISVFVKDFSKEKWKSKSHFTKIFNDEIEYTKGKYELSKSDIYFLYSLSPYLMWELNLIVDENLEPMNQKMLAEKLDVDRRTIKRHMNSLENKKCVFSIPLKNDVYYLVNPHLMYCGQNINIILPSIFREVGYEGQESGRYNRKKKE